MRSARTWYERNIGAQAVQKARVTLTQGPMSITALSALLGVSPNAARAALVRLGCVEWRRIHTGKRGRPTVLWCLP